MGASDGDTGWLEANSGRQGQVRPARAPACRIEVTYRTTQLATIAAGEADRRRAKVAIISTSSFSPGRGDEQPA
jgi:hypothetical protein